MIMTLTRIMMLMLGPLYNHQGEPQFERRQNWVKGKFDICIGNPSQEQELLFRCYQMVQLCYLFQKICFNWGAVSASVNIIIYPDSYSTTSLPNHSHDQDCSHQHPSATWWGCKKEATGLHHHWPASSSLWLLSKKSWWEKDSYNQHMLSGLSVW